MNNKHNTNALQQTMREAVFTDTGESLLNPGMGFTHYEYSNQPEIYGARLDYSDTLDDFPGLSTVYLRLPWGLLEPAEGRFDWSWFDGPAQRWIAKGKRIVLRITTSESFNRFATPKWVYDAGARSIPYLSKFSDKYDACPSFEPDFADRIFLEKLDNFLAAAAARYDGDPNVDFIDIGTLGMWGEGHTWHGTNTRYPYEVLFEHIKLHTKHFKKTRLVINDNHLDQDFSDPRLLQYCLSHGMGIRNDSFGCFKNMICREITQHLMNSVWITAPTILETTHYGQSCNRLAGWDREALVKAVRDMHASYFSIHWWPREFLEAERPLINEVNRILGYRLRIETAEWTDKLQPGQSWVFKAKWINSGVAPLYEDAYPAITFKDINGSIAAVFVDESMNLRRVLPDSLGATSPIRYHQETVVIPANPLRRASFERMADFDLCSEDFERFSQRTSTLKPGDYDVFLSVGSRIGTPRIAMPMAGHDGSRRYRIGSVTVVT